MGYSKYPKVWYNKTHACKRCGSPMNMLGCVNPDCIDFYKNKLRKNNNKKNIMNTYYS